MSAQWHPWSRSFGASALRPGLRLPAIQFASCALTGPCTQKVPCSGPFESILMINPRQGATSKLFRLHEREQRLRIAIKTVTEQARWVSSACAMDPRHPCALTCNARTPAFLLPASQLFSSALGSGAGSASPCKQHWRSSDRSTFGLFLSPYGVNTL